MPSFQELLDRGLSIPATTLALDTAPSTNETLLPQIRNLAAQLSVSSVASETALLGQISIAQSPLDLAKVMIATKHTQLGGGAGSLGAASGAVTPAPDGAGFFQSFQRGAIYWHPRAGVHAVTGVIRDKWISLGAERGLAGYPTSDVETGRDPSALGTFQHFQGASIYAHGVFLDIISATTGLNTSFSSLSAASVSAPSLLAASLSTASLSATSLPVASLPAVRVATPAAATSAGVRAEAILPVRMPARGHVCEVHGAIREKYLALGAEASILGYPLTDETTTPDTVGRFNHFQNGSIYWTPRTGAHEVHGLIRDLWSSQGWERNASLGYPVSDEMIPDRRVGHVRPESRRKPVVTIPGDVIKLPAEAAASGFPASVVNITARPVAARPAAAITTGAALAATSATALSRATATTAATSAVASSAIGPLRSDRVDVIDITTALFPSDTAASTAAPEKSLNRFSDFESGVLYWQRGATAARALTPWAANASGRSMHRTAQDVVNAAAAFITPRLAGLASTTFTGVSFAGTTGYQFDGAGVQNRRHRITFSLTRIQATFPPQIQTFQLQTEFVTVFEPRTWKVMALLTDWSLNDGDLSGQLHAGLDPLLWTGPELIAVDDTEGGNPVAILSVKTLASGEVNIYIEPKNLPLVRVSETVNLAPVTLGALVNN